MALDTKSTHVRLPPDLDHKLGVMAGMAEKDKAALAAIFLSKAVAGEWYRHEMEIERLGALGLVNK